jgi:N-formylglutamate amidohydrolase
MTDAFTDDLFAPTPFEAARVVFPVSRLVCDVERFPDEPMSLRGMGAVYVKTMNGGPLREHLRAAERARLIETWYRSHHQKLTGSVKQLIADRRSCISLPHEPDQDPARPDICIGTDDWHTPGRLRAELVAAAAAAEFSVLVDRPSPALVPAKYYRREPMVRAVMIEINRRRYMDEQTGERLPSFSNIREVLSRMAGGVGRYSQ